MVPSAYPFQWNPLSVIAPRSGFNLGAMMVGEIGEGTTHVLVSDGWLSAQILLAGEAIEEDR